MTAALLVEERAAPYLVAPPLTEHLDAFAGAPEGFKRLRELVLNLAVRGRLVAQDPKDEPATKLLDRIKAEKAKLNLRLRPPREKPEAPYELPAGWAWTSLGEAGITNPRNEARDDTEAAFVPMALIPAALDIPHLQEVRPWQEIKNGFTHSLTTTLAWRKSPHASRTASLVCSATSSMALAQAPPSCMYSDLSETRYCRATRSSI